MRLRRVFVLSLLAPLLVATARGDTIFAPDGPDADAYGAKDNYPIGTRADLRRQRFLVGSFSHFDRILRVRRIARADAPSPLQRSSEPFDLAYKHRGEGHTLADYLQRHPATGLLIAKGDRVLTERYQYGRKDSDRFLSQSMAKTIVAMLIGIAVSEGAIRSVDDPAESYAPSLRGSEYGAASIKALLQMSSGVEFSERYDGQDDLASLSRGLSRSDFPGIVSLARRFRKRVAPPGVRFSYAGIETEILGLVLRAATKTTVADYAESRIWKPMGAEADANWAIDGTGAEIARGNFNAVLRDYARFGLLLAHDGEANGRRIIPRDWLLAATTVAPDQEYLAPRKASPFYGYGYQVWLLPGPRRMFALLGVHGQAIFVDPRSKLILVHTAVRVMPSRDPAASELVSLWLSLVAAHGRE